ncbi:MAG: NUDIX hydrolase [Cycloclasticus pugetii]|jgi:8-oxo-dGTP pyrophosphatase MutT (NUDIX family)|uniref:NUDIX hydrolase n=1 Tax=Cycloclasticus TaxID=34067 RepID=UPI0024098D7D|nr:MULTISPECIES: NUDIX domain-containing protein [Cycloclasticus]MBV1899711.1 NUDIX domain-containing protein [Cycloclasticus sp.]MDF1829989.1 NUDIX domain-containing protein [Cycloclasticus pugetii]
MIREAAVLILLRDTKKGPEVCMLRRVETTGFAAGAYVFPGGVVDEQDKQLRLNNNLCFYTNDTDLSIHAYKIAAIRETLEEAGILAATRNDDIQVNAALRQKLHKGYVSFESLLREHRASLDLDRVIFYDHWIAPDGTPKRFDTRFFIAKGSMGHQVSHDNIETDSSCWALPEEILSLYEQGEVKLMPVTHVQLKRLSTFEKVSDILAFSKKQNNVPIIEPLLNVDEAGKPVSVTIHLPEGVVEYSLYKAKA